MNELTTPYTLGSLFDGSGGFPLAGTLCGIEPRWASEVEPYPIAVTRERFPRVKHLGDISKINGAEIEPVDIITFGSPCQDLSVAGKRAGLKHEANGDEETTRSGLFMEAVRIIKEMRRATNGKYPRFALWENVPGAFSSNKGEDFRVVCEELIKVVEPRATMPEVPKNGWAYADSYIGDGWSLAYRTFDAQYWGVPQRRRRIHLIADFRGECAREVLFEREGVRGYFTQGRTPWQTTPADAQGSTGTDDREGESHGGLLIPSEHGYPNGLLGGRQLDAVALAPVASTLRAGAGAPKHEQDFVSRLVLEPQGADLYNQTLTVDKAITIRCRGDNEHTPTVVMPYTMKERAGCAGGGKGPLVQEDKSATLATSNDQYLFQPVYSVENHPADSRVNIDESGKVQCLTSRMGTGGGNVPMVMEEKPVYCLQGNGIDRADTAGCNGKGRREDASYTLNTLDRPAVVYAVDQGGGKSSANVQENKAPTLCTTHGGEPVIALDRASFNQGQNAKYDFEITDSGVNSTIVARGPSAVAYSINHQGGNVEQVLEDKTGTLTAAMNSSGNNKLSVAYGINGDKAGTLDASYYKGCGMRQGTEREVVAVLQPPRYIVRRLTPTECARLQGFADQWGHIEQKDSLTDEEYKFWQEVRDTYALINGKEPKAYTEKQTLTWYNKLWTDSAEYKMWGNGIALPPALYCMQGIVDALNTEVEVTDLSDAPEEIKQEILDNAEALNTEEDDSWMM